MTDVLILGGTGWLGGRIAERWLDAGASVTCLSRGVRSAPYGARVLVEDREDPAAYDGARSREWDEVVDVSSRADHVRAAAGALSPVARHITYISSVSVYADADIPDADETAPLADPAAPGDAYDYAREKSAAEAAVRAAFPSRCAIVRPGLIAGVGDPTDRFGYWVSRFARAADGPVLVPDDPTGRVQVIDVDDLARFAVALGREKFVGVVNAVGASVPLRTVLNLARDVAGHTGDVVAVSPAWLRENDVAYWAGPRSLPLWLPSEASGFATRSSARHRLLGGALTPLRQTLADTLADERARGLDRERTAGLARGDELALIAQHRGR